MMNERIKELAKQAFEHAYDNGGIRISTVIPASYTEKFAQLIVRECARVASDRDGSCIAGDAIEEHFGVK